MISLAASLFLGGQVYNFILMYTPLFVVYDFYLVKTELKVGEPLEFVYDYYRKRICRTEIVRAVWDTENNNKLRELTIGGASEIGRVLPPLKIKFDLHGLGPGCYKFLNFTYSECSEGRHDFQDGPLKFCIVDRQ